MQVTIASDVSLFPIPFRLVASPYKRKTKKAASPLILGSLVLKSKMREAKASPLHYPPSYIFLQKMVIKIVLTFFLHFYKNEEKMYVQCIG